MKRRQFLQISTGTLLFPYQILDKNETIVNKVTLRCNVRFKNMFNNQGQTNPDEVIYDKTCITLVMYYKDYKKEYPIEYHENFDKGITDYGKLSSKLKEYGDYNCEVVPNEYYNLPEKYIKDAIKEINNYEIC